MKNTKNNNEMGITLIALIITVIILVILASISIMEVYKSKIIEHSINGAEDYAKESVQENRIINETESILDSAVDKIESILAGKKDSILFEMTERIEEKDEAVNITVKAKHEKDGKIKYKLYIGTTQDNLVEKVSSAEVESSEETTLTLKSSELAPNTTYYYRIEAIAEDNSIVSTEVKSFTTKEVKEFTVKISIPEVEYYKYGSRIEARIAYESGSSINADTIIKDETILINNKDGANAQIETIQNSEKESIVTILVGNSSGKFTLEVTSGIKNEDGGNSENKESNEVIVGTKMQRMISSISCTSAPYGRKDLGYFIG